MKIMVGVTLGKRVMVKEHLNQRSMLSERGMVITELPHQIPARVKNDIGA
jgi:hypothetical protein